MTTSSLVDFCEQHNINWFPISLTITQDKKKILNPIQHTLYNFQRPKNNDFVTQDIEVINNRKELLKNDKITKELNLNAMWIDTSKVYHIDIDTPNYDEGFDCIAETTPYFKSMTKPYGKHILITTDDFKPESKRIQFKDEGVELLCGQASYAPFEIMNADKPIQNFTKISEMLDIKEKQTTSEQLTAENNNDNQTLLTPYSELLSIIGNKGHTRNTWLILCSWFVNNSTKQEFRNFVEPAWSEEAETMFDNFSKNKRPCSKYALDNIAKAKDENAYITWRRKHNVYISSEILEKGCNDVAQFIAPRLKQNLIYCNDQWFQFDKECCLWRTTKRPDALVISHMQRDIDETREYILYRKNRTEDEKEQKLLSGLEKQFVAYHREVSNNGYVSQTLKCLATYLFDADFEKILDNQTSCVAFKNGILDLKTLNFRNGLLQSDFITKTIPHNYTSKSDNDVDVVAVKNALKKICNWNNQHLDYYLGCIGYALTGLSSREQNFWYLRGQTAENGKSVIFEALEKIMPNYVIKGTNTFLDKGAELKKEVPTWKGKRILWLNEVSTKMKDEDLLKAVCDGTDFKYNRNYATEAEKVSILFKLFCVSNNSLSVKGDAGIARRFKLQQFNSQFQVDNTEDDYEALQFVRNKAFGDDLCGKWRDALLHVLFKYSQDYIVNDCLKPYPKEWNEEAQENIADNNKFIEWFNEEFEVGEDFVCFKSDFENVLPAEYKSLKIKDELTRMKIKFNYDSQKKKIVDGQKKKGAFVGFRLIE
jgi:phage/plasmid-associated DNA primase